MLPHTRLLAA